MAVKHWCELSEEEFHLFTPHEMLFDSSIALVLISSLAHNHIISSLLDTSVRHFFTL